MTQISLVKRHKWVLEMSMNEIEIDNKIHTGLYNLVCTNSILNCRIRIPNVYRIEKRDSIRYTNLHYMLIVYQILQFDMLIVYYIL